MGGRALKKAFTRRYSKQEFETVSAELIDKIKNTFDRVATPLYYHNKETFGDIDLIVDMGDGINPYGNIRNYISVRFDPTEIFHNGNCYSFDYKEVQVDFMCVSSEDYDSNYHYLAFNDLGNYIGRIAHRLGLKYGQEGLWYNHYINDQNVGKIMVSKDYREIFKFLDLDYDRWLEGFDELEDTFKFALTSRYFDSNMFQLDSLNRINRERNLKRASYMSFLHWINANHPNVKGDYLHGALKAREDNKEYKEKFLFDIVNSTFPDANFMVNIRRLEYERARNLYVNSKFNGGLIMKKYGYSGKELGTHIKGFKRHVEKKLAFDFDEYVLYESPENIFELFDQYLDYL
jgi:hypothetical protein